MPVFAVAVLFDGTGSGVEDDTPAVFVIVEPAAPVACRTIVKTPEAPDATDGFVHVTFGVVHDQPAAGVTDTNVDPTGTRSVRTALAAAAGPLFVTVTPPPDRTAPQTRIRGVRLNPAAHRATSRAGDR